MQRRTVSSERLPETLVSPQVKHGDRDLKLEHTINAVSDATEKEVAPRISQSVTFKPHREE